MVGKRKLSFAVVLVAVLTFPAAVHAQSEAEAQREALRTLFQNGPQELSYTEQFQAAASVSQLQNVVDSVQRQLGAFREVSGVGNPFTLSFANGEATVQFFLNEEGAVAGLQFTSIVPRTESLEEAIDAFLDLPGTTSIAIRTNGEITHSRGASEPLPVGSAFKLAVLRALEDAVADSETSWETVLTLTKQDISLPSGVLQEWPTGSSVTAESAAILTISQSDKTATDLLIRHVDRRAAERYAPNSRPLLSTQEAFLLKSEALSDERERFLQGSLSQKRRILANLQGELPSASLFAGGPVHPQIEWFFTTEELAELIEKIERVDILAVNPGPINPDHWQQYGFKGGSEPGVLNMTLWLVARSGDEYAISATQSREDSTVDSTAFVTALQAILTHLR